jgi:hypothetical protein
MDKQIMIPTSWGDVTLGEFIKLSKLDIVDFDSPMDYYINMLGVLGNQDIEEIKKFFKLTDLTNIISEMNFITEAPKELDNKEVTIDGQIFKLIPNLNNITVGEYVSIESLIERDKLDSVSSIPAILSVILRPEGEEFNSDIVEDRMKLFKEKLSIEDVLGMSLFFSLGVR